MVVAKNLFISIFNDAWRLSYMATFCGIFLVKEATELLQQYHTNEARTLQMQFGEGMAIINIGQRNNVWPA